jgi:hypothetical protein
MLAESGDLEAAVSEFDSGRFQAVALGDSGAEATAHKNLATVYLALGNSDAAAAAADQAWRLHQDRGDWSAAAKALLFKLHLDGVTTPNQLHQALHRLISDGTPITNGVVANLSTLLTEDLDPQPLDRAAQTAEPHTRNLDDDQGTPAVPESPSRRRITIADEVRIALATADLGAVVAHLSTGPTRCWTCRLPIAEEGRAELLLLTNQTPPDTETRWTCLAHPACTTSRVIAMNDEPNKQIRVDLECAFVGDGYAAVYVDCHGGLGIIDSGELGDAMLSSLRCLGSWCLLWALGSGDLGFEDRELGDRRSRSRDVV